MTKANRSGIEVPDKNSDNARRRTRPEDVGPASPKAIADIYRKGKTVTQPKNPEHQPPQFVEDRHAPNYDNDVKRGYLRGEGEDGHNKYCFDSGHFDQASTPQKPSGPKNRASGRDAGSSPFSAAHKSWKE
jgi:hypothetical protein